MCVATVKCVLNGKRKTNSFEIMQLFLFTQTRLKLQFWNWFLEIYSKCSWPHKKMVSPNSLGKRKIIRWNKFKVSTVDWTKIQYKLIYKYKLNNFNLI